MTENRKGRIFKKGGGSVRNRRRWTVLCASLRSTIKSTGQAFPTANLFCPDFWGRFEQNAERAGGI